LAWFLVQTTVPLRHWLIPGQVNWTEEGHNFSWHMKLRVKRGRVRFLVVTPEARLEVHPREVLTARQARKMATRPEMIRQFAHELRRRHGGTATVYAASFASLNGRPFQRLVRLDVDLSRQEHTLGAAHWIVPLEESRFAAAEPGEGEDGD
jgi:hypothetical protein